MPFPKAFFVNYFHKIRKGIKMKIIQPSFEVWTDLDEKHINTFLEKCARNCYKSEGSIEEGSAEQMISKLIHLGHEAMLEHYNITVKFTNDLHTYKDLTRHRHVSFAIESSRWCCYSNEKFGKELTFVKPADMTEGSGIYNTWYRQCLDSENAYMLMKDLKATNDQASGVLNQSLKADVVMTCNVREWRYIFKLRTAKNVYPNIRRMLQGILAYFIVQLPTLFGDLEYCLEDYEPWIQKKEIFEKLTKTLKEEPHLSFSYWIENSTTIEKQRSLFNKYFLSLEPDDLRCILGAIDYFKQFEVFKIINFNFKVPSYRLTGEEVELNIKAETGVNSNLDISRIAGLDYGFNDYLNNQKIQSLVKVSIY